MPSLVEVEVDVEVGVEVAVEVEIGFEVEIGVEVVVEVEVGVTVGGSGLGLLFRSVGWVGWQKQTNCIISQGFCSVLLSDKYGFRGLCILCLVKYV